MTKKPFPSQREIIKACCKSSMSGNKAAYTVCEMGTGKTLMAIAVAYVLHKLQGNRQGPGHLPAAPGPEMDRGNQRQPPRCRKAYNFNGKDVISQVGES